MPDISINARFLTQYITGVQRYAFEMVKALDNLIENGYIKGYNFELLAPPAKNLHQLDLKNIPLRRVGFSSGYLWEQFELPLHARGRFLVNLCNTAPIMKRNQMVTIHDATVFAYPGAFSLAFRAWYKLLFIYLGKVAKRIITDSSFSKNELIYYCGIKGSKIEVIYLGKEHIISVASDSNVFNGKRVGKRPFILAVSSLNPNKNFHGIMNAVNLLGIKGFDIIIAGGTNPRIFKQSKEALPDDIRYIGYVSDSELRGLYENAVCLVYPSFYEGFGLPPIEAMYCGCPVIASNTGSLPEICGDAAIYCDPYNINDIAEKIMLVIRDESLQENLRQKGFKQAEKYSWGKCAQETFAVIEQVLDR